MHGASVVDEVQTGPGVAGEEFRRKQIALEAITASACSDEIAGRVNATLRQRKDVIDRRDVDVERGGAVDASPPAVTHHCVLDRALLVAAGGAFRALGAA